MMQQNKAGVPQTYADEDVQGALLFIAFVLRSMKRNWRVVFLCLGLTVLGATLMLGIMPKTYLVEARLLAEPDTIIQRLLGKRDDMTRAVLSRASEVVKSRESLRWIIRESNAVARWRESRAPLGQFLDYLRALKSGPMPDAVLETTLVEILKDNIVVSHEAEHNVLAFGVVWSSPDAASDIVNAALKRWMDLRRQREISEVERSIEVLEIAVDNQTVVVEALVERVRAEWLIKRGRGLGGSSPKTQNKSSQFRALQLEYEEKFKEMQKLEASYQMTLSAAQSRLSALSKEFGPSSPKVKAALYELDAAEKPGEQLTFLKSDLARLRAEQKTMGTLDRVRGQRMDIVRVIKESEGEIERELEELLEEYNRESVELDSRLSRLEQATMELGVAQTAFEFRYRITRRAVPPQDPIKPLPLKVVLASLVAGLFVGIFFAVFLDLQSDTLIERWQIERTLDLPLLGDLSE